MKTKLKLAAYAAALLFAGSMLTACGGDDTEVTPPPPPPPGPRAINFTAFVHGVLIQPGTSTPVAVNDVDFDFPDRNNPQAYCDILPPSTTGPCADGG